MPKMEAPQNGVTIRMYRPGHGDCFLLAFPRKGGGDPVYVLIDCGYKPGSPAFLHKKKIDEVVNHIGESTGHCLDLVIITHEHQDHVNGFWKEKDPYFQDFKIEKAWLAWTEDPADNLANNLRLRHNDQLLGLIEARQLLALSVGEEDPAVARLDNLLSLEFGGEDDTFVLEVLRAAVNDNDPSTSINKQAMKLVKDKAAANQGVSYLRPGDKPRKVISTDGIRAFVLGPPRKEDLLLDEDPVGDEGFPDQAALRLSFGATLQSRSEERATLFDKRFQVPKKNAFKKAFFNDHYGKGDDGKNDDDKIEVPTNAPWRRIDAEWLYAAENLALKLNRGINNTSLVLAFELPSSKKVLLFAGDAQRGNWISWDDKPSVDGDQKITARELLARTVLYKVGHHGSHNATLSGSFEDKYPNLSWMAQEQHAGEFTAMITAVNEWALKKNNPPWRHPLPSIKKALEIKAQGRVFQTDVDQPAKPKNVSDADWNLFLSRTTINELYFDYTILDV